MRATAQHLIDRGFYRWPIGPEIWRACDTCNHGGHTCHFCGDDIGHGQTMPGPNMHACYVDADEHFEEIDAGYRSSCECDTRVDEKIQQIARRPPGEQQQQEAPRSTQHDRD